MTFALMQKEHARVEKFIAWYIRVHWALCDAVWCVGNALGLSTWLADIPTDFSGYPQFCK